MSLLSFHERAKDDVARICRRYCIEYDPKLSSGFIRRFVHTVDWTEVSHSENLSEEFIDEFFHWVDWYYISHSQNLSEEFIADYSSKVNWHGVSSEQVLSEKFIRRFSERVIWHKIFQNQKISLRFAREFGKKAEFRFLMMNKNFRIDTSIIGSATGDDMSFRTAMKRLEKYVPTNIRRKQFIEIADARFKFANARKNMQDWLDGKFLGTCFGAVHKLKTIGDVSNDELWALTNSFIVCGEQRRFLKEVTDDNDPVKKELLSQHEFSLKKAWEYFEQLETSVVYVMLYAVSFDEQKREKDREEDDRRIRQEKERIEREVKEKEAEDLRKAQAEWEHNQKYQAMRNGKLNRMGV